MQGNMEELKSMFSQIQKEIAENKIAMHKMSDDIQANLCQKLDEKLNIFQNNFIDLQGKVENQENRLYILEKQARSRNLVIFGLQAEDISYSSLESMIIEFINKHLKVELKSENIESVRRIGKPSGKPRPIILTLVTLGKKIEIIKNKRELNGTKFYITEDYPKHILEKRKELQKQAKIEIEKGNKVQIKYDKLIILKDNFSTERRGKKKREPSSSPQNQRHSHTRNPVTKKNKITSYISAERTRSHSLSDVTPRTD